MTDELVTTERIETQAVAVMTKAEAFLATVSGMGIIKTEAEDLTQKEMQAAVKGALKEWDAERHSLTDPLERVKKDIIARFKVAAKPAEDALEILNRNIKTRYLEVQAAARKEQARLEELARKRQERAEVRAEAKGEEPPDPVIAMPAIAAPAKTTVTSQGKVTVAEYWTGDFVTDETAAVRAAVDAGRLDLLCYNTTAAKAMIRAGIRNIPGFRVYQELKV